MKKKINLLRIFTVLVLMTTTMLTASATVGDTFFDGNNVKYKITSESYYPTVAVIGVTEPQLHSPAVEVNIPTKFHRNGKVYIVTEIEKWSFRNKKRISSVNISHTVRYIREQAFWNCTDLKTVTIATNGSETRIEKGAFRECRSLTSITLPNSLKSIGENAFYLCENLSGTLTIPNTVTSIRKSAFSGCSKLKSVILPNTITEISDNLFAQCRELNPITIPNTVTSIGEYAFEGCNALVSITIPSSVVTIKKKAFSGCFRLASVTISNNPNNMTTIGDNVFNYCSRLSSISIPQSVGTIGNGVFSNCSLLNSITVDANNGNYCSNDGILFDKQQTKLLCYPANKQGNSYNIPNTVQEIGHSAFFGARLLRTIIIPTSVTTIQKSAFSGVSNITTMEIPTSVTTIGNEIFKGCSQLQTIDLPASISVIPSNAFEDCRKLTSVTIPQTVTTINFGAFLGCQKLVSIIIPNSVTTIQGYVFSKCTGLTTIISKIENLNNLTMGNKVFYKVNKQACTLKVPQGTKGAYELATQWRDFENIEENQSTGICNTNRLNNPIALLGKNITVSQVAGKSVRLYNLKGQIIENLNATQENVTLSVPQTGTYILQVDNGTRKIVVN